jgi:hypothetical protein
MHLLPESLTQRRVDDTSVATDPAGPFGTDGDVTTPLGRSITPGRIITGTDSIAMGSDGGLSAPVRR